MRRRGRYVEWCIFRKQECRGLKNGRAEGGAAEADGKDVLGEWWWFGGAANSDDGSGLRDEQKHKARKTK